MGNASVWVVYRKFDGSLHWHQKVRRLGEDEHGVWVGAPPGATAQRGYEPQVVHPQAHVLLFPRTGWWTAVFNAEPERVEIYCDVTTVPLWRGAEVTMVDLDLDVRRLRTGQVQLLDEDEFAVHRVRYGYPERVVQAAESAAQWLADALRDGTEPFSSGYRTWLARAESEPEQ